MANQSVDDFIMSMVGMGFEVEDAQQAFSVGKLTVEEAIDWILAGKPTLTNQPSTGTTLRLHQRTNEVPSQPIGSNPFMNPQPMLSLAPGPSVAPSSDGVGEGDEKVVSRTTMNDEQRKIKDQFEEKQRDEARRLARMEKAAQKKAKAQVLQQIQEDRMTQRMRRGGATGGSPSSPAKEAKTELAGTTPEGSSSSPVPGGQTKPQRCLLQIRLPDGRALRETFEATMTLREVWNGIQTKVKIDNNMGLMQPFPRREYGEEDMTQTLDDLKLTPSGSLVLKKKEVPTPAQMEVEGEGSVVADASVPSGAPSASEAETGSAQGVSPPPGPPLLPPPMEGSPSTHHWGAGHKFSDQDQPADGEQLMDQAPPGVDEDVGMDVGPEGGEGSDDDSDDEDMDMPPLGAGGGGGFGLGFGQGVLGGGGMGPGWNNNWNAEGHMWGEGQPLMGNVLQVQLPHHTKDPKQLAAEAARRRFASAPPVAGPSGEELTLASHDVPRLVDIVIKHVGNRVCDSRQPIVGMQGLPADIAFKILDHLKQERLLRPKTLHAFVSCRIRKLVLDSYLYATNELLLALRLHTNISSLSLASCSLITDKGLSPLKSLKRLMYLNLSGCQQITDNCLPVLQEFQSLVTLALEDTKVTDTGLIEYTESKPPNLQHLNLNRTTVSQNLLLALHAIPNLRSLSIEYTKVSSLSGVQEMKRLETLNVCGTLIVTDSLLCLGFHPTLTALNIAHTTNVNGDLGLQYIQSLPLQMLELPDRMTTTSVGMQYLVGKPLHTLDLTNYMNVTDEGVQYIGRILSLRRLRLSNSKLTDVGMLALNGLEKLEELYVDRTSITDVGAAVIGAFSKLRELSLSQTSITNVTLRSEVLSKCPVLSKVNLSRNWISNKGLTCLRHPYLALINLDSTRAREDIEVVLRQNCPNLQKVLLTNLQTATASEEDEYDL